MVAARADGWRVTGLLDPGALYADVEFELAYMEVFGTVGDAFHTRYREARPAREGYDIRRLLYWLNTMLTHVHVFGSRQYIERTATIARDLGQALSG